MDGLNKIIDELKNIMDGLFDGYVERDGVYRSIADNLGVTDVSAIVEVALESGISDKISYPVLHFLITIADDIPEEYAERIKVTLSDLNLVISCKEYPSFGCFCYEPSLRQIFLSYRMPVNPGNPDGEITNLRYYFGVLYEELDLFADFIMFICDNSGKMPDLPAYLDYLQEISDMNDMEERVKHLTKLINDCS